MPSSAAKILLTPDERHNAIHNSRRLARAVTSLRVNSAGHGRNASAAVFGRFLRVNALFLLPVRPTFRLCGNALPYTESYKYLGHIINSNLADDADIITNCSVFVCR